MLVSREELHQVKQALGRFYGQMRDPSKLDRLEYQAANRTMALLLDADADKRLDIADLTIGEVKARVEAGELDRTAVLESGAGG